MKERPILFSAPMVRAILDGSKTMTRRIVKPQPEKHHWEGLPGYEFLAGCYLTNDGLEARFQHSIRGVGAEKALWVKSPYGSTGDRLWVREAWSGEFWLRDVKPSERLFKTNPSRLVPLVPETWYWADGDPDHGDWEKPRPSIHMPRWASRITLEITGVMVERLRDISEDDAMAEGATPSIVGGDLDHLRYRAGFQSLWESINGAGSWDKNPWVWVISFKRI